MLASIFDDLYRLQDELDEFLFSDYRVRKSRYPGVNLYENEDEYVASVALPGIEKDDVKITIKDNSLKINGEIKRAEREKGSTHLEERFTGKFEKNIMLQERVDADKIEAELKNGILLVKIPKSPETKPVSINIK